MIKIINAKIIACAVMLSLILNIFCLFSAAFSASGIKCAQNILPYTFNVIASVHSPVNAVNNILESIFATKKDAGAQQNKEAHNKNDERNATKPDVFIFASAAGNISEKLEQTFSGLGAAAVMPSKAYLESSFIVNFNSFALFVLMFLLAYISLLYAYDYGRLNKIQIES